MKKQATPMWRRLCYAFMFSGTMLTSVFGYGQCTYPNPAVSGTTSIACGQTTSLTAFGNGSSYRWYDDPNAGNLLYTGATYTTPVLGASDTFYVETADITNNSASFSYTGGQQSWVVPAGVYSIQVDMTGAQGGSHSWNTGGLGGRVQTTLSVTPGQTLYIYVGGEPTDYQGGYNGGGATNNSYTYCRGGGGGTDIRIGGTSNNDRVVVAGGGGGAGRYSSNSFPGGAGGGSVAVDGGFISTQSYRGGGGSQSAGGTSNYSAGSFFSGGTGNYYNSTYFGGGGGGGWYGGGGGHAACCYPVGSGGGGSSYTHPSLAFNVIHTQGYQSGNGYINITWDEVTCSSAREQVIVSVNQNIAPPIVNGMTTLCGTSATITASGSTGIFQWYDSPQSTSPVSTTASYTTPVIVGPKVFYVEAITSINPTGDITFGYTGSVQTWTVPAGVTSVTVDARGAGGGSNQYSNGGMGGRVQTVLSVTPGQVLEIYVGGQSGTTSGGWNGGGNGYYTFGRGGGGASDIRTGGSTLADRIIVAGGGGGAGAQNCNSNGERGGHGGGSGNAQNGFSCNSYDAYYCGAGGSQSAGGSNASYYGGSGSLGQGANSSTSNCGNYSAGGGGGGYYGGGGGSCYGGGGGGSSYTDPSFTSATIHTQGFQQANGEVKISWYVPHCKSGKIAVMVSPTAVPDPSVQSATVTCGSSATISVSGSTNQYNWYTQASGGVPVSHDSVLTVDHINNATYYVEATTDSIPQASVTHSYTGAPVAWTVPAGVTSITFDMAGAQGGNSGNGAFGGLGGRVQGQLNVTPGEVVYFYVGQQPSGSATGGWNGGGNGYNFGSGTGGGGASDIRIGGNTLNHRVVVAGGGGGTGWNCGGQQERGGNGGGSGSAESGYYCNGNNSSYVGGGGNQGSGGAGSSYWSSGATVGSFGQGGNAYSGGNYAGGGGGGWYGGGGGSYYGGGGGGSSYANPQQTTNIQHTQGYKTGGGYITIMYDEPYCVSNRIPVQVTVNPLSAPTVADDTVTCGAPAILSASGSSGNYHWYTQASGGNEIAQGSSLALSPVTSTTTYYVEASEQLVYPGVTQTFNYTGSNQTWTVPANVTSITVDMAGAESGFGYSTNQSGKGGRVQTTLSVTPGDVLHLYVGGHPGNTTTGGWNGGGNGYNNGKGGGGGTDIRIGGTGNNNRVVIAGGGGGPGGQNCNSEHGGNGGDLIGGSGRTCNSFDACYSGAGGTQSSGGANNTCYTTGSAGLFQGANAYSSGNSGGGGGGGYYGGGSGGYYGGGGGGSSYTNPQMASNTVHTQGYQTGHGYITISYAVSLNCISNRVPVTVHTDSLPAPVLSGNATFCDQGSTVFTASSGNGTFQWFDAPGGNLLASGNTYNTGNQIQSHTYYVRYDSAGCVSEFTSGTLTIDATPDASILTTGTFCSSDVPFTLAAASTGGTWSGSTGITNASTGAFNPSLASIGNNQVIYTASNGACSDADTVTLVINQGPDATIASAGPFCSNGTPFNLVAQTNGGTWSGTGITNAQAGTFNPATANTGSHIVTYSVTQNGCTATDTILLVVNPIPDASITSVPGTACSNVAPFNLSSQFGGGTWSGTGITNPSAGTFDPSAAAIGNNTVTYTLTQGGCSDSRQIVIPVTQAPNATIISNPGQLCDNGAAMNLIAQTPGGFWTGPGITNSATGQFTPSFANQGTNTVYYNVTLNGCSDADTLYITVNAAPVAVISPNTSQTVCEGSSITLTGSGGSSYQWLNSGTVIGGATNPAYIPSVSGIYQVQVTDGSGCSAVSVNVPVSFNPAPVVYAINAADVCEGAPATFTQLSGVANTNGSIITGFHWDFGDLTTTTGYQAAHTYANPGTYTVQLVVITNHGCTDTLTDVIHINPSPVIDSVTAPAVCHPNTAWFDGYANIPNINGSSITSYTWNFGDNFNGFGQSTGHNYTAPGIYTYSLQVNSNKGCNSVVHGTINVESVPAAMFLTGSVCSGSAASFTDFSSVNGGVITGWNWNFGDGSGTSQVQNPVYTYNIPGTYPVTLTVTSSAGCTGSYAGQVQVLPAPDASWSATYSSGTTVNFAPGFADPNAQYTWQFDDGTTQHQMYAVKTYEEAGVYNVCLTVVRNGCTSTYCMDITVAAVGVEEAAAGAVNWSVYPNPFNEGYAVEINLLNTADLSLVVYDMTGRVITRDVHSQVIAGTHVFRYNANELTMRAGVYVMEVRIDGKPYTTRILKAE